MLALAAAVGILIAKLPVLPPDVEWDQARPYVSGPDIILITVDTLSWSAARQMSVYKELAEIGLEFESAQAPAPWTLPSMATILTGMPPVAHGAGAQPSGGRSAIASELTTLATELSAAGYDTAGVAAPNPYVGPAFGFDRGFDYFYQSGFSKYALPRGIRNLAARPLLPRILDQIRAGERTFGGDGEELTDHALRVADRRRTHPLFLWIHYLDTHIPYRHTRSDAVSERTRVLVKAGDVRTQVMRAYETGGLSGKADLRELQVAYMDEVQFVDRQIRRLLDGLRSSRDSEPIVVLTSDHGEEFFEHGGFLHGHTLYQELLHVPLVISGLDRASRVEEPVGMMDIAPTLLAAVGRSSEAMVGIDLRGAIPDDRRLRSGNMLYGGAPHRLISVRRARWKAIFETEGAPKLFDLVEDPGEQTNLAGSHARLFEELVADQLEKTIRSQKAVPISAQTRAQLEALGYVDPAPPSDPAFSTSSDPPSGAEPEIE